MRTGVRAADLLRRAVLALTLASAALPAAAARPLAITFDDLPATGPAVPGETRLDVALKIIAARQAGSTWAAVASAVRVTPLMKP